MIEENVGICFIQIFTTHGIRNAKKKKKPKKSKSNAKITISKITVLIVNRF